MNANSSRLYSLWTAYGYSLMDTVYGQSMDGHFDDHLPDRSIDSVIFSKTPASAEDQAAGVVKLTP